MRRLTATAATLAALGLSVGPSASAVPSPAGPSTYAARPGASVTHRAAVVPAKDVAVIVLDTLTPSVVGPGKDVTITGTVTAPLTGPLSGPEVRVVRGDVTVTQRSTLDDWATGRTETSGRTVDTTSLATVAAGQTRPFTATVPWERLRSDDAFAAVPISVEVVQEGASEPTGMTRTFIAWNGRKEYVPLKVATVLPVTLDPAVALASRDDATRLAAWEQAIGPDSRVARILEGTRGTPVDLALDASVLGPDLGAGSGTTGPTPGPTPSGTPTSGGTGTTTPAPSGTSGTPSSSATGTTGTPAPGAGTSTTAPDGTQTPAAPSTTSTAPPAGTPSEATLAIARLGDAVVAQLGGRSVWALPYADADVAATVGVDPANSLVRDLVSRASTLAARLGQPARADIVWPVDGLLPAGREQGIKTLLSGTTVKKAAGIVVNAAAVTKETAYTPTARRVTSSGTRLLAYDARLSALLPKRTDPSPVLSVQRYLAETLVLLGERAGTPRSVLVTAPRTYDPDAADLATFLAATSSAPWLETVDAASLLTDSGSDKAVPQTRPTTAVVLRRPEARARRPPPRPDGRPARHARQRLVGAARRRGVRAHLPRGARRARQRAVALEPCRAGSPWPTRWTPTSRPRRAPSGSCRARARSTCSPRTARCASRSRTASTTPSRTSACGSCPTTPASGSSSSPTP